jgi:hypothetical protein
VNYHHYDDSRPEFSHKLIGAAVGEADARRRPGRVGAEDLTGNPLQSDAAEVAALRRAILVVEDEVRCRMSDRNVGIHVPVA